MAILFAFEWISGFYRSNSSASPAVRFTSTVKVLGQSIAPLFPRHGYTSLPAAVSVSGHNPPDTTPLGRNPSPEPRGSVLPQRKRGRVRPRGRGYVWKGFGPTFSRFTWVATGERRHHQRITSTRNISFNCS